jgi:hypothetical protein
VACRSVARQRPQHTRDQKYGNSVFYVRGQTVAMHVLSPLQWKIMQWSEEMGKAEEMKKDDSVDAAYDIVSASVWKTLWPFIEFVCFVCCFFERSISLGRTWDVKINKRSYYWCTLSPYRQICRQYRNLGWLCSLGYNIAPNWKQIIRKIYRIWRLWHVEVNILCIDSQQWTWLVWFLPFLKPSLWLSYDFNVVV